jgi:hypothetical protein
MKRSILLIVISAWALSGCTGSYSDKTPVYSDDAEKDDYAVYSTGIEYVYLRNLLAFNKKEMKSIIIISQTNDLGEFWRNEFISKLADRDIEADIVEAWRKENLSTVLLERKFDLGYRYELVTRAELDEYEPETFFNEFYRRYPDSNGLISVSRIGYDGTRNTALVHVIHNFGTIGTNYYFLLLERSGSGWVVTQRVSTSSAM